MCRKPCISSAHSVDTIINSMENSIVPNENENSDVSDDILDEVSITPPKSPRVTFVGEREHRGGFFTQRNTQTKVTYDFAFHTVHSGFLQKKTRNVSFTKKFFVLTPYRLLYYEDAERAKLNGCFALAALKSEGLTRGGLTIRLVFGDFLVVLRADCELQAQMWYLQLRKAHQQLPITYCQPACPDKFWKQITIGLWELDHYAESLDLLLFKSKHIGASLQRFFTVSDFDHLGLLFRNDCGHLYLLHTTSSAGVSIVRWNRFTEYSLSRLFDKVGFRKLVLNREGLIERAEKYVEGLVGKKYQISLAKLLRQTTAEDQRQDNANRTFFCSELVADLYRKLGLLPKDRSACSYWPKDFSRTLPLANGRLSDLMTVQLN